MCYLSELLLGFLYVQVCVHLSELLLGVLYTQLCCVIFYMHLCVYICADIYALSLYFKYCDISLPVDLLYCIYVYQSPNLHKHRLPGL